MKTSRIIPICLALMLATATSAVAQHAGHDASGGHPGDEHGHMGFLEELHQGEYSETELAAIRDHLEAIHRSMEEIMGLHDHEGFARNAEELHEAATAAFERFLEAYESVVAELEDEHAGTFTGMLFRHLLHAQASHAHGGDGHAHGGEIQGHAGDGLAHGGGPQGHG